MISKLVQKLSDIEENEKNQVLNVEKTVGKLEKRRYELQHLINEIADKHIRDINETQKKVTQENQKKKTKINEYIQNLKARDVMDTIRGWKSYKTVDHYNKVQTQDVD